MCLERTFILFIIVVLHRLDESECTRTVSSHIDYNCSVEEVKQSGCLNDGVCFIVQLDTREPSCHCHIDYTGKRCQELNLDALLGSTEITILVCAGILLLLFGCVSVYIWYRRRHKLRLVPCRRHDDTSREVDEMAGTEQVSMLMEDKTMNVEMTSLTDTDHTDKVHGGPSTEP